MNPLAKEWVEKSEADLATAQRELAATSSPNPDAVCFHAQQCVEKLMKAVLAEKGVQFPKKHDLVFFEQLVKQVAASWTCDRNDLLMLAPGAVDYRYPGQSAGPQDAKNAVEACDRLRRGYWRCCHLDSDNSYCAPSLREASVAGNAVSEGRRPATIFL